MRGPNQHYDCTSGPNKGPCRYCALKRYRAKKQYCADRGLPAPALPTLPPAKRGRRGQLDPCPCSPCVNNRWRVFDQRAAASDAQKTNDASDLDRKALEKWPAEWGARA